MIFGISGTKGTVHNRGVHMERLDCITYEKDLNKFW